MRQNDYDVVVVGGGPAGLAAALSAQESGAKRILIAERDDVLGGILNQCIHNGFGLHYFGEELTGPEYAGRFIDMLHDSGIDVELGTMVLELSPARRLRLLSASKGPHSVQAGAVVLAMGCRERPRGAIGIPGDRPAGILTAGTAQRLINIDGWSVGERVVILGSGDIGLIMARRLTLEGASVLGCIEIMPYSSGLNRNIVQCLNDFNIPLYLSHTVTQINGRGRVQSVEVAGVDKQRRPLPGTEFLIPCDTVLLSVGLIPENELSRHAGIDIDPRTGGPVVDEQMQTSVPGIFACGNVVHVHDLVDFVTEESQRAGRAAAEYQEVVGPQKTLNVEAGEGISYTVPQQIHAAESDVQISFRVRNVTDRATIVVRDSTGPVMSIKKRYLAPGEMQKMQIPVSVLREAHGDTLTVQLEAIE